MEIVMPAGLDISPQADRLVGRPYDTLTETESRLHDHLSLHGELFAADVEREGEFWTVSTQLAPPPAEPIIIRVFGKKSAYDAAWELARVVDYIMNKMPAE